MCAKARCVCVTRVLHSSVCTYYNHIYNKLLWINSSAAAADKEATTHTHAQPQASATFSTRSRTLSLPPTCLKVIQGRYCAQWQPCIKSSCLLEGGGRGNSMEMLQTYQSKWKENKYKSSTWHLAYNFYIINTHTHTPYRVVCWVYYRSLYVNVSTTILLLRLRKPTACGSKIYVCICHVGVCVCGSGIWCACVKDFQNH